MKFIPDGSKLKIIPETAMENTWVGTLRPHSKRVKPGSEYYVKKAFFNWRSNGAHVESSEEKASGIKQDELDTAIELAKEQASEKGSMVSNLSLNIILAETLCQKMYGVNLNSLTKFENEDGLVVKCIIHSNERMFFGTGNYKKQARAKACREFYNYYKAYMQ